MGFVEKLITGKLPPRFIWFILLIVTVAPILRPIGLPIKIRSSSLDFYNIIDEVPDGSKVLINIDLAPIGFIAMGPGMIAISHHLFEKDVQVFYVSFLADGPAITERVLTDIDARTRREYGTDWVSLGYIPGMESGMYAWSEDISMGNTDQYGTSLDTLPIMSEVSKLEDFDLIIFTVFTSPDPWFRQWGQRGVPILMHVEPAGLPLLMPYFETGLCEAFLHGPRGGAEYEMLVGRLGEATKMQDQTNLTLILAIFLIVLANIGFVYSRRRGES